MPKIQSTPAENKRAREFFAALFQNSAALPFSFTLDGVAHHGFNESFSVTRQEQPDRFTLTARHTGGLQFTLRAAAYPDHAAFEWTVFIKNTADTPSPIISELRAADLIFEGTEPSLCHFVGDDHADPHALQPLDTLLRSGTALEFEPLGGRPSSFQFPYFILQYGGGGAVLSVGWPGQWRGRFDAFARRDAVRFTAGQAELSASLLPGEEIRTPLMTFLLFDSRDADRTANLWRRFFIDCNMRKIEGGLMPPVASASTSWLYEEMRNATDDNQIEAVRWYEEHGVHLDYWWMDAGWYCKNGRKQIANWTETGSWEVDKNRFPSELRAVSDFAGTYGTRTLLWFEPERVTEDTYLHGRPEWLLGGRLADFGNPDFRAWLTERVDGILRRGGISLYRQDFNIDPLEFWRIGDREKGPDRTGITENHYVTGYLCYWDELIRRHPDMMLDSCASGGRRNDLETMRRSVPLHKTDADYSNFTQKHGMHHTLFRWFPYFATPVTGPGYTGVDEYSLRSAYVPWLCMCYDVRGEGPERADEIRRHVDLWRSLNGCFYGDYYMLTPWCNDATRWIGWQFYDHDREEGLVQLFRQQSCAEADFTVYPGGLDEAAVYILRDVDGASVRITGAKLMREGYTVHTDAPGKAVLLHIVKE